jgi:hypothetical protein
MSHLDGGDKFESRALPICSPCRLAFPRSRHENSPFAPLVAEAFHHGPLVSNFLTMLTTSHAAAGWACRVMTGHGRAEYTTPES